MHIWRIWEYKKFKINNHIIYLNKVLYSKDVTKDIISGIELAKTSVKTLTESVDGEEVKLVFMDENY